MSDRFNEREWREIVGVVRTAMPKSNPRTQKPMSVSDDVDIANENNVLVVLQGGLQSIIDALNDVRTNPNSNVQGQNAFIMNELVKLLNIVLARESFIEPSYNTRTQILKSKHRAL